MNFRLTAILFGAVFVIGVVLLILSFSEDKGAKPEVLASELAAAGAQAADVDVVEIEKADGSLLLIARTDKERNTWQIQKPISARADAAKVLPVVTALLKAKPIPYKDLSSDPAVHGLSPVKVKVTLRQGAERSSTINLGDVTLGERGVVFVTTSAQPKRPMAVPRADLDPLFKEKDESGKPFDLEAFFTERAKKGEDVNAAALTKWTSDFRSTAVFPSDARARGEDVASIRLELPNKKKVLELARSAAGSWKFGAPFPGADADTEGDPLGLPDKFTGVNPLLSALANVTALTFIEKPGDLKQYGLNPDNPDRIRIEMKTKDGQSAVVFVGKIEPAAAPPPPLPGMPNHPPVSGGKVYVSIKGQDDVILASATNNLVGLVPVITDPSGLRDRNLLAVAPGKQVDGINLLLAGQPKDKPIKLRRVGPGGEWKLYGGPNDPQPAYKKAVDEMVAVLTAKRSIKDFPAPNPANFVAVSAIVFVWADGFGPPGLDPKAEPAERDKPTMLEFGRKEGETIYVRRTLPNGTVSEFAVAAAVKTDTSVTPVDVLGAVLKSRLDLLDRSLPSFSDSTPVRLTAVGAGNYAIAREDKPAPGSPDPLWRFAPPDPRAGQVADGAAVRNDLIYVLANLSSQLGRFVWEDPDPAKLAEYGFTPVPRLKVTVELPPETAGTKRFVFEFGKDAAEPDQVYARFEGRPAVFTLPKRTLERLAKPDLRDRVVFRDVPTAKVNVVEVTGWGGIALKFEKNAAGVWESKPPTPGAFVVDSARVAAFLDQVSRTSAKSFVAGPPDPKLGFGDPKQTLDVTLRWPGEAGGKGGDIRFVIAGPADAGASYYVWSSRLPADGSVFTVEGLPLKAYKDGTAAFAK